MTRCWKCKNCLELAAIKRMVLAICAPIRGVVYPSPVRAGDDVVSMWNAGLKRLPCTGETE